MWTSNGPSGTIRESGGRISCHESLKDFTSWSLLFGKDTYRISTRFSFHESGYLILLAPSDEFIYTIQTRSLIFVSWLNIYKAVRFKVLTAANMKITAF